MDGTTTYASDVAFTPTVKAIQLRKGSRDGYAAMEERGSWQTVITPDLAEFVEGQISVFLGTASKDGQPYIQHCGGPPGFLKVLDDKTIGFADFAGNRQYITQGSLAENPKARSVPDRLRRATPRQAVGRGTRRRERRRAVGAVDAGGLSRPAGASNLFKVAAWDTTARSISPSGSRRPRLPRCCRSVTRGSGSWRRKWHGFARRQPAEKAS